MNPYDDTKSRQLALNILKAYNPRINPRYSVVDITCDDFYVDVKNPDKKITDYKYIGINKSSYEQYVTMDKPVYVLFIFNDNKYTLIDVNTQYNAWSGYTNDKAKGRTYKTIYNYPINNAIKLDYD
jgi:hypothetical protein